MLKQSGHNSILDECTVPLLASVMGWINVCDFMCVGVGVQVGGGTSVCGFVTVSVLTQSDDSVKDANIVRDALHSYNCRCSLQG